MVSVQQTPLLTLLHAPIVAAYTAAGFWRDETIYHLAARHAHADPHAFAVRDRHRRLNYAEMVEASDRLAAHLAGCGIRPGHRVAVWLPSRVESAIALIACSRNGSVFFPTLKPGHYIGEIAAVVLRFAAARLL